MAFLDSFLKINFDMQRLLRLLAAGIPMVFTTISEKCRYVIFLLMRYDTKD